MAKKEPPIINDFAVEEDLDICGFSDAPIIIGECIASFKFNDDSDEVYTGSAANLSTNNIVTSESAVTQTIDFNTSNTGNNNTNCANNTTTFNANVNNNNNNNNNNNANADNNFNNSPAPTPEVKTLSNDKDILTDNRNAPIVNGCAPPINGEYLDIKRTYMLRSSTVRKLNELKSINHDLNTYVSTIVDMAIAHYYDHIVNDGGTQ